MKSSASAIKQPSLDSVTTINEDGSRYTLHPADVRGTFTLLRRLTAVVLLAIYVALPWIKVGGFPAVFLDIAHRRFHLFGLTFAAQDAWLLFFVITGLAFSLFYVTALFGRLWCGWTCPYTIFMEHVYRRVERWIDGDATARRKLDAAPMSVSKFLRRTAKHGIYILISALLAHVFLSYFVSIPGLYDMMTASPAENLKAFGIVMFLTGALYFSFSWFREQFCIVLCPYGRLQSALTDEDTIVIGYDEKRGEPRGKPSDPSAGDCIDCKRCIQVCPTGIDIRNGLQLECIGCSACVDACDAIMTKLKRPKGLVRYDSLRGLRGLKTRWLRPRTFVYTALMAVGAAFLTVSLLQIKPLRANLVRMQGAPYILTEETVRNHYQIRVINKLNEDAKFRLELMNAPDATQLVGTEAIRELAPMGESLITIPIEIPKSDYEGPFPFRIALRWENGDLVTTAKGQFLGPHPRLIQNRGT